MAKTLKELTEDNMDWTMDKDNIFIVYEPSEEVEFTATSNKIAEWLASYFSQPEHLYVAWGNTNSNTDTGQKGIKIKNVMYDIIVQCLDQDEMDRIEVIPVVNGPWYSIPPDPGFIPDPPDPPELDPSLLDENDPV